MHEFRGPASCRRTRWPGDCFHHGVRSAACRRSLCCRRGCPCSSLVASSSSCVVVNVVTRRLYSCIMISVSYHTKHSKPCGDCFLMSLRRNAHDGVCSRSRSRSVPRGLARSRNWSLSFEGDSDSGPYLLYLDLYV